MRSRLLLALCAAALGPAGVHAQRAEQLYGPACEAGDLTACNVFGLMLESGDGVTRDVERAAGYYQRACEGGALIGCTNLGLLYQTGVGVSPDVDRALGLFRIACEGGEQLGCDLRAAMTDSGGTHVQSGFVGDARTGRPLAGALVELPSLGVRTVSGSDGRVNLGRLAAGLHLVHVERVGYERLGGIIEVPGAAEFVLLLTEADGADLTEPGRIEGRVTDPSGDGLAYVEVAVRGQDGARTLTNGDGRFALRDVTPGLTSVDFTRLGYAPRATMLVVQPGRVSEVSAVMSVDAIDLDPVEVTVRSSFLEQQGFYRRARGGWGRQLTRAEIQRRSPILVSDVIDALPGVRLEFDPSNPDRRYAVSSRTGSLTLGSCVLGVYLDGVRMADADVNQVPPEWLEAMEVYVGVGTPAEYTLSNPCGVVLMWTQR